MKHIANIITKFKMDENPLFNYVENFSEANTELPSLIVGFDEAKKVFQDKFNILDWKIDNNIFWCYGQREKRDRFENSLIKFKDYAVKYMLKCINYDYYNIFTQTNENKEMLKAFINSNVMKYVYINNNMIYICNNKNVIGISMLDLEFIGSSSSDFISRLKTNKNITMVNKVNFSLKNDFNNKDYVIPYLFS